MKTLYIECAMGAAGDMLAAALLELLPDRAAFLEKMNGLGIPGVTVSAEKGVKCGVSGTHFSVRVSGVEEDENLHSHHHNHVHGSMEGIEEIVNSLPIPSMVKLDVLAVYNLIAEAESRVHGVSVQQIHFHEVGTMDAVADITAVCLLMREIRPDQVIVSPVSVGSGTVRCAHGILPVPAPATALLLEGMPIQAGNVQGELCTPTGAALLKYFADDFGSLPVMRVQQTGYGIVMPGAEELKLEKPEIVKKNGNYAVKLRASAPSIHMLRAQIETEISPMVGGEQESQQLIDYLLGEYEEDTDKLWQSNIFGKSLYELVSEGVTAKIMRMPDDARQKLTKTLGRMINENTGGMICILL